LQQPILPVAIKVVFRELALPKPLSEIYRRRMLQAGTYAGENAPPSRDQGPIDFKATVAACTATRDEDTREH